MRKWGVLLACLLLPLLSACAKQSSTLVQVSADHARGAKPVVLAAGQAVSGVIATKKQGSILAFDVLIGNYHGRSDGALSVKLCAGIVCAEGRASVANSADNRYLEIPLERPIDVAEGRTLHYELTRIAGVHPLAVWTYPDAATTTAMPDGAREPRVLKIGFRYKAGSVAKLSLEIGMISLLLVWLILKKLDFQTATTVAMVFAAGLILAMIVVSAEKSRVHPDELSHVAAYQYYVNHLLPPAVDDPATIPSTSVWGFSYLFELDVVYDIAARATGQIRAWTLDEVLAGRLFQFGLWCILCVLVLCRRYWATILCVTLVTPQVWYVFSYFNADAFALFLSLIAAGLVADESGGLHDFVRNGNFRRPALWIAALCIGLILVSKRDYLPVVPAFFIWLAVLHLNLRARFVVVILGGLLMLGTGLMLGGVMGNSPYSLHWHRVLMLAGGLAITATTAYLCWKFWRDGQTRRVLLRLTGFAAMCIAVALPRIAWDVHVNGWPAQKDQRVHAVAEERAGYEFKPSTIAKHEGHRVIGLAGRGVSIERVFFAPYHWASKSLASAFGVYGYMDIFAPRWMYWILYGTTCLLILLALYSLRVSRPDHWGPLAVIVGGSAVLVVASSLLLSWISALQPQGRYLFAILPLVAMLLGYGINRRTGRVLSLVVGMAFLISACSFTFVALSAFAP